MASEKAHRGGAGETLKNGRKNVPKIYTCPLFGAQEGQIEPLLLGIFVHRTSFSPGPFSPSLALLGLEADNCERKMAFVHHGLVPFGGPGSTSGGEVLAFCYHRLLAQLWKRHFEQEGSAMAKKKVLIGKDEVWKGLHFELDGKRLGEICQQDLEPDFYYDLALYLDIIHQAAKKEVDYQKFLSWCIFVSNSLNNLPDKHFPLKVKKTYYAIADLMDGLSFVEEKEFRSEIGEFVARLRYEDYLLRALTDSPVPEFSTDGVFRYLCLDHANRTTDGSVFDVIILDKKAKRFDKRYIDSPDFKETVNYIFVDDKKKFERIFNSECGEDDVGEDHSLSF